MWLSIPSNSDFSIHNLPFGIFKPAADAAARAGIAIGDEIIDLAAAADAGLFGRRRFFKKIFEQTTLNDFIALARRTNRVRRKVRSGWNCLENLTTLASCSPLAAVRPCCCQCVFPITLIFSAASSVTQYRQNVPPHNPLLPNWRWIPVAYHGRASSIVVSGTPIKRPHGQILPPGGAPDSTAFWPRGNLILNWKWALLLAKKARRDSRSLGKRKSISSD